VARDQSLRGLSEADASNFQMVEPPFMTDELVEVLGKSGLYVVWRPGTNGELVVAEPCGGLPFEVPYQDVKRWPPQAIISESSAERHLASRNDDGQGIPFGISTQSAEMPGLGAHFPARRYSRCSERS
jgi:hypothetical protein